MLALVQALCLIFLVMGCIVWVSWVRDTSRIARAPEQLNEIVVHGGDEKSTQDLARAVLLGFIGWVAEHKRAVSIINNAASHPGSSDTIAALTRVSTATPSLLHTSNSTGSIDIKLEIAGTKLETQGLQRWLLANRHNKGALSISLLLDSIDKGALAGTASASFTEDGDYGFSLPVSGSASDIAYQLAMRYVQAHYAKGDPFYAALSPVDFRKFWKARGEAAELALKQTSSSTVPSIDDPIVTEARDVLKTIEHLVKRYRRKAELQKLGAYLSIVTGDLVVAKEQLGYAVKLVTAEENKALTTLIEKLDRDIAQTSVATRTQATPGAETLEQTILRQKSLRGIGFERGAKAALGAGGLAVRVHIALGAVDPFPQFGDRILGTREPQSHGGGIVEHTNGVAGLLAALAPTAQITVTSVLESRGTTSASDIVKAIDTAVAGQADILLVPLTFIGGAAIETAVKMAVKNGVFVVWPAGNDGKVYDRKEVDDTVFFIGAAEGDVRAVYSNYGDTVRLFAPGTVLTYLNPLTLREGSGTTYAATIVAAGAANLIAASGRVSPAALAKKLDSMARPGSGIKLLDLSGMH